MAPKMVRSVQAARLMGCSSQSRLEGTYLQTASIAIRSLRHLQPANRNRQVKPESAPPALVHRHVPVPSAAARPCRCLQPGPRDDYGIRRQVRCCTDESDRPNGVAVDKAPKDVPRHPARFVHRERNCTFLPAPKGEASVQDRSLKSPALLLSRPGPGGTCCGIDRSKPRFGKISPRDRSRKMPKCTVPPRDCQSSLQRHARRTPARR